MDVRRSIPSALAHRTCWGSCTSYQEICLLCGQALPASSGGKGKGVGDRGRDTRHRQEGRQEGAHQGQGPVVERGPRGRDGWADLSHRRQAGQGAGTGGGREGRRTGEGGQGDQAVRCVPRGIQQMPAHTPTTTASPSTTFTPTWRT